MSRKELSTNRRSVLFIAAVAVIVQIGASVLIWHRAGRWDAYAFNSLDCGEYFQIAHNLARAGVFSQSESPPYQPDTWRTPGYPLFLAGLMIFLGNSATRLIIAQQVLSILNVVIFHAIARRLLTPGRAGWAAVLLLLEPYRVFYSFWLMSTTWFVTVLLLAWFAWVRACESGRGLWFAICGFLMGSLILIWPLAVLFPGLLAIGMFVNQVRQNRTAASDDFRGISEPLGPAPGRGKVRKVPATVYLRPVLVFALCAAGIVGTWMLRNWRVGGHFALSHQSGIVLAYFKGTEVALWRTGRTRDRYLETSLDPANADQPHSHWESVDAKLRAQYKELPADQVTQLHWCNLAQGNRTTLDSFQVSQALARIALAELAEASLSTIACYMVRMADNLTFPLSLSVVPYRGLASTSRSRHAAIGALYLLLVLGAIVRLSRRNLTWGGAWFSLFGVGAMLLTAAPQVDPRFRVPLIPLLLVIALLPGNVSQKRGRAG